MIRLSLLFVAVGIAALVFAQIASRPPPPRFRNSDLVGSWVAGGADQCGSGKPVLLTVTADGHATVHTDVYRVSGRLLRTEGFRVSLFPSRVYTLLRLVDDEATRWRFVLNNNPKLTVLDGAFTDKQDAHGNFMVMPRLPHIYRCS